MEINLSIIKSTNFNGLTQRGKVRDVYDLGDELMIVSTDRISAFDIVMDQPIPEKGMLLTYMSQFWLETLPACSPHHLLYVINEATDKEPSHMRYIEHINQLRDRSMIVNKVNILPVECIVRGYLAGNGWKEYSQLGSISGIELPLGLRKSEKLPKVIFTPTTKASVGHDEPVSFEGAANLISNKMNLDHNKSVDILKMVECRSVEIYSQALEYALSRGIILADTKFEFGLSEDQIILADEVLTPDSSRFWPLEQYKIGVDQPSFDKQFLRDYLESTGWNKQYPPPVIPDDIIIKTSERYNSAYKMLIL